jgi:predicted O-linked N-acetylglucosamine transferase (SPINDLY family)
MASTAPQTLPLDVALQQAIAHHQAGRLQDAEPLYRAILQAQPRHAEANHNLGMIACQVGQHAAGLPYLQAALAIKPSHGQFSISYAEALLATGRVKDAQQILQSALQHGLNTPAAQALRQKVDAALRNNRTNGGMPPFAEIERLIAQFQAGHYEVVENSANALSERYPLSGQVWKVLGASRLAQGKDARHALQRAADLVPSDADNFANLGKALRDAGQLQAALTSYDRVLTLQPDFVMAHCFRAGVLQELGQLDLAVAGYRRALELDPTLAEAYNALGSALRGLGQRHDAVASYRRALTIKPDYADAWCNLGTALWEIGQVDEAVSSLRRAVEINPDFAMAHNNLGTALRDIGQIADALASYRRALELDPGYADASCNLGLVLQDLKQFDEALACYHRALAIRPEFAEAYSNLGDALKDLGQIDEAVAHYRRALAIKPDFVSAYDNLLMALQFTTKITAQDLFEAHKRFGEQYEAPLKSRWPMHTNSREPDKRLKIGYVSGDFRQHAVAYFIEPVLANHDKTQVEVFCYANSRMQDAVTDRLKAVADHWQPCAGMSDDELAQRIQADGIDILVDLSGHTAHNRLLTFARKPAPIQITYLGYPGGSGLSAMDYRLTDRYTESGDDQYYTEKLLRLPGSVWCYRPADNMPDVTPLPALANGCLTFGSFNNCNKIGDACIPLWAALLRSLPTARLLMATVPKGEMRLRLTRQFEEFGVASERLAFYGKLPAQEFQRKLQEVDITLDPFPVNGATTTCESLWLGVPVLTLVGGRFLSRAGLSILSAAGLAEFAAATQEEYIQVATKFANDLPRLAEIRAGMRERLKGTPLLDQQGFTRNLEGIYREVWRRYASA